MRFIPEHLLKRIEDIGSCDIVVGVPSRNNATTIEFVLQQVTEGLKTYFSDKNAVIINSDGFSEDGTRDVVEKFGNTCSIPTFSSVYEGPSGKGAAIGLIFEVIDLLKAKVGIMVDSDLRSIRPNWIDAFVSPILGKGFDYVTPYYYRYKYDATITNNIAYPLTRALYGKNIRQPIGGDFGWSKKANTSYLSQDPDTFPYTFGIDIWMTTTVLAEGLKLCQAVLGAKIHDPRDPAAELSPMFRQVVGTLFRMTEIYKGIWKGVSSVEDVPTFKYSEPHEPEPFEVDLPGLLDKSRSEYAKNRGVAVTVLPEDLITEIENEFPSDGISKEFWAEAVYYYCYRYNMEATSEKEKVLDSLIPLWNGRTAKFIVDTQDMDTEQAEKEILRQANVFLEMKHILTVLYENSI